MALAGNGAAICVGLAAVVAAAMLTGCGATGSAVATHYDPAQSAYARARGTGVISGQAFLQKPSGSLVYGAGKDIYLFPVTAYSLERIARIYGKRKFKYVYLLGRDPTVDRRFLDDVRVTRASSGGNFEFAGLASGSYIVETGLTYTWHDATYGGRFYDIVEVGEGETVKLVLTGD